jgi:O-antigen ligase
VTLVYTLLLAAALVLVQVLIGGTQFAYSFPAYAIVGLAATVSLSSLRRTASKMSAACLVSALFFAGYVLVRAWASPNAYLARFDAYLAAACLAVYLLTALYVTQTRHRIWVISALLAVAVVHVVIGAFQFKSGENWYLTQFGFYLSEKLSFRGSGLLICANHTAGYLEALALFALSLTIWGRAHIFVKLLAGYVALLCYAGVVMTGSRGGYLSSAFSLLVFAALTLWIVQIVNRRRFLLVFLGTVAGLALLFGIGSALMNQSSVVRDRLRMLANATQDVRYYNWLATLDQFKQSPVVGTGSGTHLYYGRLFRRPQIQADPEHAHGDYLETLAEYGIVGSVLALAFLLLHLSAGLQTAGSVARHRLTNTLGPARSDTLALTLGSLAAVAALMSHSVVDFNMHIPGNALLFAFIFGMLSSPGLDRGEEIPLLSAQTFLRVVLGVVGVGLLWGVATQIKSETWANRSRLALSINHFAESTEWAQKAIEADPKNPNVYFYQGEAARACANNMPNFAIAEPYYEEAIASYRKGLEYFPQDENLWVRMGQALDGLTRFEEAEEAYRQAITLDPSLGILYAYYGAHFRLKGEEESAKKCDDAAHSLGAGDLHEIGVGERPALPYLYRENVPKTSKE